MALGELINEGKALQYLMGKKMYQVYWKRLFGGTPYERHLNLTKVTAKSINFSRIIESGEAHLFGMFEGLAPLTISPKQAQWLETPYPGVKVKPGNNLFNIRLCVWLKRERFSHHTHHSYGKLQI